VDDVLKPLAHYPNRNWSQIYRKQYAYDREFSWVCAPNDTYNCRITAHVHNGVIVRLGEQYDFHTYTDLYGKHASAARGKRHCANGLHVSPHPLRTVLDETSDCAARLEALGRR
jgi:nitrate reductase alpha subunit